MIERILVLIRNIVHVPASPAEERRTDDDVSIHDQVLWYVCQFSVGLINKVCSQC